MEAEVNQYIATLNEMMITCYNQAYRNTESLNELKKTFEKLANMRKGLMLRYQNFPGDLSVSQIVEEISKALLGNTGKAQLQWTFDHYTDLFRYKAQELIDSINKFLVTGILQHKKN